MTYIEYIVLTTRYNDDYTLYWRFELSWLRTISVVSKIMMTDI